MSVTHAHVSFCQGGYQFPERSWELTLYLVTPQMEVLFQIASYISADASLMVGSIPTIKTKTIKAYIQVQELLLRLWFRSKLIEANYTKQFCLTSIVIGFQEHQSTEHPSNSI